VRACTCSAYTQTLTLTRTHTHAHAHAHTRTHTHAHTHDTRIEWSLDDSVTSALGTSEALCGLAPGEYTVTVTDSDGEATEVGQMIEILEPTELVVTGVATTPSCLGDDGTIDITVEGGVPVSGARLALCASKLGL
jgi:hypothetical protein